MRCKDPVDHKSTSDEDQDTQREFIWPPIEAKKSRWGIRGKTFWDWMDLLVVPFMLAIIGISFTLLLDMRQQAIEDRRAARDQRLENQRAQVVRETEEDRAQNEAVQAYLDAMDALLRDTDLRGNDATFINRGLAQARTTTIIATLDAERNRIVTRFLRNLGLTPPPVSILDDADLAGAELAGALLDGADLSGADLHGADLRGADLKNTDLSSANLSHAKGVTEKQLQQQVKTLEGAIMPTVRFTTERKD